MTVALEMMLAAGPEYKFTSSLLNISIQKAQLVIILGYIIKDLILAFWNPQGTYTLSLYYIKKKPYITGYITNLQYINGFEAVWGRDLY